MSKTILTVDDSRVMRDLLNVTLNAAGYNVIAAVDGQHGLEVAKESEVDGIITDINMPKMDGFEFMENLRLDSKFNSTPILVLTTESADDMKGRARAAGASGWIVKPFDEDKLLWAIARVAEPGDAP